MVSLAAQVKNKIDIIDLIQSEGVVIKRSSSGNYTCCCPFHQEKTPSFKVSSTFQNYKCFGCGEYGDAIQFFAKRNQLDYHTATLVLAERLGIEVDKKSKENYSKQKRELELTTELANYFKDCFTKLDDNHPAKQQILSRKLEITGDYFGYAPSNSKDMINYLKDKGYSIEEMKELGFVTEKDLPLWRDRLIFFICNYMGQVVGFSGRSLEQSPEGWKYVNSKDSSIFHKKEVLFNIDRAKLAARKLNKLFLVEGQFDVVSMVQHNYPMTVAISGTAFNDEQIRLIRRCVDENGKLFLCLDGDGPGFNAMVKIFQENPSIQHQLYIIILPKGVDPCDYFQENEKLPHPHKLIDYLYRKLKKAYPLHKTENRKILIDKVQDEITQYIQDSSLKEIYLRSACTLCGISYNDLQQKTHKFTSKANNKLENDSSVSSLYQAVTNSDLIYIQSLAFYIANKSVLETLDTSQYPEKYQKFLKELSIKFQDKFIPENFSLVKLAKKIAETQSDVIEDSIIAQLHYNSLIRYAHKLDEQTKLAEKQAILMSNLDDLSPEQLITALQTL